MNIKKDNILLRSIEDKDLEFLREMINDPEIKKMTVGQCNYVTEEEHLKWFSNLKNEKNRLRFMIEIDRVTIGTIILENIDLSNKNASISIKIGKTDFKGKGYGTKALRLILKYAFDELDLHMIYANVLEYNEASKKLFEKCGFKIDGIKRDAVYRDGKFHRLYLFSIIKEEFINDK